MPRENRVSAAVRGLPDDIRDGSTFQLLEIMDQLTAGQLMELPEFCEASKHDGLIRISRAVRVLAGQRGATRTAS